MGMIEDAAELARELHEDQLRKGSERPYFDAHLEPVAELVRAIGGTDEQIAAAYLHDAPEDQGGLPTLELIRDRFGDDVADIVEDLSDSLVDTTMENAVKEDWILRKARYVASLEDKPVRSLEVSVADKLHNATSILHDYRESHDDLWEDFNAKRPELHLWYYESLLSVFQRRISRHALVPALADTIAAFRLEVRALHPDVDDLVCDVRVDLAIETGDDMEDMEEPEEVVIVDVHKDGGVYRLTASIGEEGALVLHGSDTTGAAAAFGDEYEYGYTVPREQQPQLLLNLLTATVDRDDHSASARLKEIMDAASVEYRFWSR